MLRPCADAVDGNDVIAVCAAAQKLVTEIREGGGPRFLECRTVRVRGHFEGDPQKYRQSENAAIGDENDPIYRLERRLAADGVPAEEITAASRLATERVAAAVARARKGSRPDFAAALADVYSRGAGQNG